MSMWKDQIAKKSAVALQAAAEPPAAADFTPTVTAPPFAIARDSKESLIAAELTIEGKIEGTGQVRIAGKFKGDVNVQGDLSIERGAKVTGSVRARKVTIAGELEGNIVQATQVDLQSSAIVLGDIKAETLTVAAGSRIRGQINVGADEAKAAADA